MFDNIFPVWRVVELAQVRLQLSAKDLESSTLPDTVCSNETEHVAGPRHRKPVKLEAIGRVPVGDLGLEVGGQVDDGDGVEGAFFGTDTATDAETLGYEG